MLPSPQLATDHFFSTTFLRVRSRITSQDWRPDLRQISSRPMEQTGGIAPLLRGSAIEERPKMREGPAKMARRSREDGAKVREDGAKMGCQNVKLFLSGP